MNNYSFVSSDCFVVPCPPDSYFIKPPQVECVYNNPTRNDGAIVKAMIYSCDRFYKPGKSKRKLKGNSEQRKSFLWNSDWRKSVLSDFVSDDEEASIGESDCSYETFSEVFPSSLSLLSKPELHRSNNYINYELAALSYTPVSTHSICACYNFICMHLNLFT